MPVLINCSIELFDLTGIFPAEVAAEQVEFQLNPLFESQALVESIRNKETGLIAGDHPLAHKHHYLIHHLPEHSFKAIYFQYIHAFLTGPCAT